MKSASAFVPGHISGFFQVCDEHNDFERKGSRNCGPCISAGVRTEVSAEPSSQERIEIFVDGRRAPEAKTSLAAVRLTLQHVSNPQRVVVRHRTQAPVGAGYGLSGAGALGAVFALSEITGLGLKRPEVASVAHRAEVSCSTGLGDVGAQMIGGLVIGVEPGAPPHGKWKRIRTPKDLRIVCGTLGPLETKQLLQDPEFRQRSKKAGGNALRSLTKALTIQNFMGASREFAREMGILDSELLHMVEEISSPSPFGASAVMLGKAVFAPVRKSELEDVKRAFLEFFEPQSVLVTNLDFEGAKLIT
jgi:pantoate kinase